MCKEHREFPVEFVSEGFCDFCAENIFMNPDLFPELFKNYFEAINKKYVKPMLENHSIFFSDN